MSGNPLVAELSALLQDHACQAAAAILCARHDLDRDPPSTPWTSLFSPPAGGRLMELGAGFGDDSLLLATKASEVIAAVPDQGGAELLAKRLAQAPAAKVRVAVLEDLARLPLEDDSLSGIGFAHAAESGFIFSRRNLPRIAREFARVLAPGGALLIGLPTPMGSLVRRGLAGLGGRPGRMTFERAIKRRPQGLRINRPTPRRAMAELIAAGFEVQVFCAPLPNEEQPAYLLPLDDPGAAGYFLSSLVRRDLALTHSLAWLVRQRRVLERIEHLVPYCYLALRAGPRPGGQT